MGINIIWSCIKEQIFIIYFESVSSADLEMVFGNIQPKKGY